MLLYQVIKERFSHADIGRYSSYGIKIIRVEHNKREVLASVSDISTDKRKVIRLASLCKRKQLAPIHLLDVVEDFIG